MEDNEKLPIGRKLFTVVTQSVFAGFLVRAKNDGWILKNEPEKVDIDASLGNLITAYAENRVVILSAHDVSEAVKALAKSKVNNSADYGTHK